MKRILFSVAIAAALGAGSFAGFRALNPAERQLSDIELANIEALAEDENDFEGETCYNSGKYNADSPKTVVCDNPCKLKNWNPGLWPTTSFCL